jgi:hypothetical protein
MPAKNSAQCADAPAARVPIRIAFLAASLITLLAPSPAVAQTPSKLQSLVNDTATQFKMAYRHNTEEHRARYDQLSQALAAWKKSPRGEENDKLLADWLRAAIRRSMPGSREALPPLPDFKRPTEEIAPTQTPAEDKRTGDPFADDPIEAAE